MLTRANMRRAKNVVTLGVQALIRDDRHCVLLVQHGYRPGWHFPGGGVERGEPVESALRRELEEEVGVVPLLAPQPWGIYAHFDIFPGDHIILFIVNQWRRSRIPVPNYEIRAHDFFDVNDLPQNVSRGTRQRLLEIAGIAPLSATW
jgi:8-oxo-dGTP pyrophosphatase MutT (NUDIX family)